jgi:hypothetical protein
LSVDRVPSATGELTFLSRVVAARFALASHGVVVVPALGVETAFSFAPTVAASLFGTEGTEFATVVGVSDASFLGEEAARADIAGSGASAPDTTESDVTNSGVCEVADGGLALVVDNIDFAIGSGRAEDLALACGDVGEVLALGDATDVVLPVALIGVGATNFVLEEFAASCAVVARVGSTRKDFAHVTNRGDVAILLDVDVTGSLEFATGLARECVGIHDAARVGSASSRGFEEAASVEAAHTVNPVTELLASDILVGRIVGAGKGSCRLADFFCALSSARVPAAAAVVGAGSLVDTVAECAVTSTNLRSGAVVEVASLDGVTRSTRGFASAAGAALLVPSSPQAFHVGHAFHLTGVADIAASEASHCTSIPFAIFSTSRAVEFVVCLAALLASLESGAEAIVPEALGVGAAESGGGVFVGASGDANSSDVVPDAETGVGTVGLSEGLARFGAAVFSLATTNGGDCDFASSVGEAAVVSRSTGRDGSEDALVLVAALDLA